MCSVVCEWESASGNKKHVHRTLHCRMVLHPYKLKLFDQIILEFYQFAYFLFKKVNNKSNSFSSLVTDT